MFKGFSDQEHTRTNVRGPDAGDNYGVFSQAKEMGSRPLDVSQNHVGKSPSRIQTRLSRSAVIATMPVISYQPKSTADPANKLYDLKTDLLLKLASQLRSVGNG